MKVPFFVNPFDDSDIRAVTNLLKTDWITSLGPTTRTFEEIFRDALHTNYAITISSCTAGLDLSLKVLDVGGTSILLPSFTFHCDADVILHNNAYPAFVDVDEDTFNISIGDLKKKIHYYMPRVLILTHYAGQLCNMKEIVDICAEKKIIIIEDCAHIFGDKAGSLGDIGVFSFYSTKPISCGQGGMVVTNSSILAERITSLRHHCMSSPEYRQNDWQYDVTEAGYNYCMSEMQSALGINQLVTVQTRMWRNIYKATYLTEILQDIKGIIPPVAKYYHNYHLYTIRVTEDFPLTRNELKVYLKENGIETTVKYIPIHKLSLYKKYENELPVTNRIAEEVLCLPMYPRILHQQLDYVAKTIREVIK